MYCNKCGKEINDEAVVCIHCGCAVNNGSARNNPLAPAEEDKVSAIIVICTILIPLIGIILGIVNLCKKKTKSGGIYLGAGIGAWVLNMIIFAVIGLI